MRRYVFAYNLEAEADGNVFLKFPSFPEIICEASPNAPAATGAHNAIILALQAIIIMRDDLPESDDPDVILADGFVRLSVNESMKLEIARIYRFNCKSVAELAKVLGKSETAARRLLDLRHRSTIQEMENAARAFGKRLVHHWSTETPKSGPGTKREQRKK